MPTISLDRKVDLWSIIIRNRAVTYRVVIVMARADRQIRKDRILEAAIAEYSRFGLKGARVDRIAKRAAVNKRMLYYYFGSKDDLYRESLHKVYLGIIDNMRDYLAKLQIEDPAEQILAIVEAYFHYLRDHPEYVAMIAWENLQQGRYVEDAEVEEVTHPMVEYVSQLLKENNVLGHDLDMRHYMIQSLGAAFFYYSNQYTLSLIFGPDLYLEDEARKYLESIKKVLALPLKRGKTHCGLTDSTAQV